MTTVHDRVHARRDLDEMRAGKDLSGLVDALNADSTLKPFPVRLNAQQIMGLMPQRSVIFDLLQSAANGEDVSTRARALLSDEGAEATEDRFDPPRVTWGEVNDALYNPDGSEK